MTTVTLPTSYQLTRPPHGDDELYQVVQSFWGVTSAMLYRMAPPRTPVAERIKAKILVDDRGCWIYQGYLDKDGYGRIKVSSWESQNGRPRWRGTHALLWEDVHGPIPEGLQPDHLCRVPACCNPEHIEMVTPRENIARSPRAQVTRCPHGHEYTEENTYLHEGRRHCRRCKYMRKIERRSRLGRQVAG